MTTSNEGGRTFCAGVAPNACRVAFCTPGSVQAVAGGARELRAPDTVARCTCLRCAGVFTCACRGTAATTIHAHGTLLRPASPARAAAANGAPAVEIDEDLHSRQVRQLVALHLVSRLTGQCECATCRVAASVQRACSGAGGALRCGMNAGCMPANMHAAAASCVPLALLRKYSQVLLQQYDAAHVCSSVRSAHMKSCAALMKSCAAHMTPTCAAATMSCATVLCSWPAMSRRMLSGIEPTC